MPGFKIHNRDLYGDLIILKPIHSLLYVTGLYLRQIPPSPLHKSVAKFATLFSFFFRSKNMVFHLPCSYVRLFYALGVLMEIH